MAIKKEMLKTITPLIWRREASLLTAVLVTLITFNWAVPTHFDADTALLSIMSMQKVTLFYWGQDRYANFLPFIFSWISSPTVNLLAIYFTAGLSFFLLLELISNSLAKLYGSKIDQFRLICFLLFIVVSAMVLNKKGIYTFAFAAQPYSLSFLLLGWAWQITLKDKLQASSYVLITLMMLIAVGINPSIMIINWMMFFIVYFFTKNIKHFFISILVLGIFFFWNYLSQHANAPHESYSQFNAFINLFDGLNASIKNFSTETEHLEFTLILLFISSIIFFYTKSSSNSNKLRVVLFYFIFCGLFWWCLFVLSAWASKNDFHFRYFFPSLLVLITFIATSFTLMAINLQSKFHPLISCSLLFVIGLMLVRPIIPIKFWYSSGAYDGVGHYMDTKGAKILAGGYWQVWPALFRILSITKPTVEDGSPRLYGAAYRGHVNKAEIDSMLINQYKEGKIPTAVCIGAEPTQCIDELNRNSSFAWAFVEQGQCVITKCHLLQIKP